MTRKKITKEQERELLTNRFTAPFKGETVGHIEVSEEDRRKAREFAEKKNKEFFEHLRNKNKNKDKNKN
jgi:hypothetical protein